nr:SRPBCC domain-containing protein [Caldimonas sp.]
MNDHVGTPKQRPSTSRRSRPRRATAIAAASLALAATAAIGAERAIDKEVVVAAPIESVWQAWTTRAGIRSFFAPDAEIDPRVGGAFHIHINPFAEPGMKGADDMRYMALQRPTMLSFDWNAPPSLPEVRAQRTFVVVRLAPLDAGSTRVTLHHTGWGSGGQWDDTYAYFDRAWGNVLGNLKKSFESGPIDWTDWLARMRAGSASAPR